MKDKWLKFFRRYGRAEVGTDRALKNLPSKNSMEFIHDKYREFNDMQKIRA